MTGVPSDPGPAVTPVTVTGGTVLAERAPAKSEAAPAERPPARPEPGSAAGPPTGPTGRLPRRDPPAAVRRLRVVAGCVALTALAFQQRPGAIAPDTKLDLVVDPGGFLRRALGLWEPTAAFGHLQNQSDGYLFPMGPFFWLGHAVGLPAWAVQRLWVSLVLCLAFTGVVKLAGLLRIGAHGTRLLAGAAFALSPGILTVLGAVSAEALPTALAPWVLVPLVSGARDGSPRRWAALSGLAVLAVGGVNAAATLAVLPLPALWLACLPRGPRRRSLAGWWALAVALASLWWVVPLLVLGRYSPPFLDYIETAGVTTARTSLVEVLRGTSHWVPYLSDVRGPLWPAGHALLDRPALVLDTVLVAGLGLAGLLARDLPHRRWLLLGLLCGVAVVCFGHVGPVDGVLADQQRRLLDGALAPLRNVHKYDVVLRLPLALAGAHLATRAIRAISGAAPTPERSRWRAAPMYAASVYAAVGAAVLGVAAPMFAGILVPRGSFADLPGYWRDAAGWLRDNGGNGRALLAPGSSFADYYWGRPGDEPLQPLARSPWAVRNAIPLTPPETIRLLDAVQQRLAAGRPSDGLAPYLARAGVRFLVVRNDLDYAAAQSARPLLVHQAVVESPGLELRATFGPTIGGGNRPGLYVDQDLDVPLRAVEVFEVRPTGAAAIPNGDDPRLAAFPLSEAVRVAGGPEALLDLADRHWLANRPTVLAGDGDAAVPSSAPLVVTDSPRRQEVQFGRLDDAVSATLTRDEPTRLHGPAPDYLWPGAAGRLVVADIAGARAVRASSARSYPDSFGPTLPENQPFAAIDSSSATSWRSDPLRRAVGAWWEVELAQPREVEHVRFRLDTSAAGPTVTAVRVGVDAGAVTRPVVDPAAIQDVPLPGGPTQRLRITVAAVQGEDRLGSVGLRDVMVPGLRVTRRLVVPPAPASAAAPILAFRAAEGRRDACYRYVGRSLCATGVKAQSEDRSGLDRTVTLPGPASYDVSLVVRPQAEPALTALLAGSRGGLRATASSAAVADPAGSAQAAVDAVVGTGWVAAAADRDAELRLAWPRPVTLTGLWLWSDDALAASRPRSVEISAAGRRISAEVNPYDPVRFPPLRTATLTIHFRSSSVGTSINPYDRTVSLLPVGVSEVIPLGPDADQRQLEDAATPVRIVCGRGPTLRVGGRMVPFAGTTTRGDLLALRPVELKPCGAGSPRWLDLPAGTSRLVAASTDLLDIEQLTMVPAGAPLLTAGSPGPSVRVQRWQPADRSVRVAERSAPALLVVHENANAGWTASLDGRPLPPVRVDGWQQGWVLPTGAAATVELRFGPDRIYRAGLAVGAVAVLGLVALAAVRPRRTPAPHLPQPAGSAPARVHRLSGLDRGAVGTAVLGAAVLAEIGGLVGVGLLLGVAAVLWAAVPRRRWEAALWAWVLAGFGTAGLLLTLHPWPADQYAGTSAVTQVGCLAAIAALALAPAVASARRPPRLGGALPPGGGDAALQPEGGTLDEVVRDGGDGHPAEPGHREDREPASAEHWVAEQRADAAQDQQMPEEDPVGDPAEPARRPAGEHPAQPAARAGPEDRGQ